jgi:DegV family protein with EDD domain
MSLFYVDSSCDLEPQQIKSLGIECFNLPYKIDGQTKTLDDDFDYAKFYSKVRKGVNIEYLPLSVSQYEGVFEPALKGGDDVIYVHPTSKIFDTTNLIKARKKLCEKYPERRFEIIDSKNFSAGHASVCFALALKYKNGQTIDEIVNEDYKTIDSIACYMVVDSLENLSKAQIIDAGAVVGSTLNIKSILAVDIDGNIRLVEKVSGKKRALNKLIQLVRQTGQNIVDNPLFITNSLSSADAKMVVDGLKEYIGEELKVLEHNISPTNTTIVGNGVVAIAFRVHKKIH